MTAPGSAPTPIGRRSRFPTLVALTVCAMFVAKASIFAAISAAAPRQSGSVDASGAIQNAARLVEEGRLDDAEVQARQGLSDPSTRAVANSVLGTISFQRHQLDESVIFFKKAIQFDDRLVGAHLSLAQVYALQGKLELALPLFERVMTLDPSNGPARLGVARVEMEKGRYEQSLAAAAPALAAFKQSPEGLFVLASDFLNTGKRSDAVALADDWARLTNVPREWTIRFGVLFATHGVAPQAVAILEHARDSGGRSFELSFNLAGAYLLNDDLARALETYDEALALKPDSVPALQQAAVVAERRGELERSLSYWIRSKKIMPDDPAILLGFGRVCLRMDLLEDADEALAKAAGLKPGEIAYQYTLAAAKVGKRQFEEAQRLVERLVEKKPADPQLQYALGSILYLEGQLPDAATHLRESLRLQPDQLASHYYLALVLRDQGKDAEAIGMLETLLQRFPDHAASSEALGGILMTVQRYDEAERRFRDAIRVNPKLVKANYQLGLLLSRTGRKEEADRQLALAKSLREEDAATSRLQLRLLDPGQ